MKKQIIAALILFFGTSLAGAAFVPGPIQVKNGAGTATSVGFTSTDSTMPVSIQNTSLAVTGTFFQGTQPISGNVQLIQNTVLGATVTFNGTQAITVIGTPTVQGIAADNGVAAATDRINSNPGIYQTDYANGTAGTQGRNSAQDHGTDGLLWVANLPAFRPASFSVSSNTIASAAGATALSCISGNASNTVLVYALRVACTETTAGNVKISIAKHSTAYTGAWSTMTPVAMDSAYTGPVSTAAYFTANPVEGTQVGEVDNYKLGCMASATASPNDIYMSPPDWRMKPIVLRGTAQNLCVSLLGQTVTGGSFAVSWSWIETKTITP